MKILLITQLFPYKKGGKETSGAIREFAEEWSKMGHKVKVIRPHFSYEREPFPANPSFQISDNINVDFIKPIRIPLLKYTWYSKKKIQRLISFKPDVIICHLYNSYFTFHWLAEKLNAPLIIGIHMSDIRISKNKFHRWHQNKIFAKASAFACRSFSYERLFQKQFPGFKEKTFVALSGIPDKYIGLKKIKGKRNKLNIITVSSLIKRKQIDKILLALSTIPKNIDWGYKIIGSGTEKQNLETIITNLKLTEKVQMCGQYSRDKVIEELLKSDVFVLPSYNETLGLVYLEAMACGCVTIGSKNEGIDGIIVDGENGFLCDPFDEESITQKIKNVIYLNKQERDRIIHNAKASIDSFSIKNKAQEYIDNINIYINRISK
ncbi:MAG: glycosyltransferase family 4 protein [Bacteroidota bacterium]